VRRLALLVAAVAVLAAASAVALKEPASAPGVLRPLVRPSSPDPLRVRVDRALASQSDALRRGDEAGFLAVAEPALHPDLKRRFATLRALGVVGWTAVALADPSPVGDGRWRVDVRIGFCLVVEGCPPPATTVPTVWTGSLRLAELGTATEFGPRPWEVAQLVTAIGARVVVAAPPALARRLPAVLAAAERAAALSDRYARWRPPPGRYLVHLAGAAEWQQWYGGQQAWVAGVTMPLSTGHMEIMLNSARIDDGEVEGTLAHEFAHVTTLAGASFAGNWLLVEGLAEYVRADGRPVSAYKWLGAGRRLVRSGRWGGTADLREPAAGASIDDAAGRYAVAYLAVRRLAERFGEDRMLALFAAVVREATPLAQAAPQVLGAGWPEVAADCDEYVRRSVS